MPYPVDQAAIAALRNQSRASLSTPTGPPAWLDPYYDGRRSYFRTLLDRSIPAFVQEIFVQSTGVPWTVESFNSSHSPFLSHPKELSNWVVKQASLFART